MSVSCFYTGAVSSASPGRFLGKRKIIRHSKILWYVLNRIQRKIIRFFVNSRLQLSCFIINLKSVNNSNYTIIELHDLHKSFVSSLCVAFVDYEKGLDSVQTQVILTSLQEQPEQGIKDVYM